MIQRRSMALASALSMLFFMVAIATLVPSELSAQNRGSVRNSSKQRSKGTTTRTTTSRNRNTRPATIPARRPATGSSARRGYVPTTKPAETPPPPDPNATTTISSEPEAEGDGEDPSDIPMVDNDEENYEVVAPPPGATVPYLPDDADEETVEGKKYFVYDGTYYRPFASDGDTVCMVVEDPKKLRSTSLSEEGVGCTCGCGSPFSCCVSVPGAEIVLSNHFIQNMESSHAKENISTPCCTGGSAAEYRWQFDSCPTASGAGTIRPGGDQKRADRRRPHGTLERRFVV